MAKIAIFGDFGHFWKNLAKIDSHEAVICQD